MSEHDELRAEQQYLDHAYERVDELRAAARGAMDDVLDVGKGGTFQARTERDVVVRNSLARIEQLDLGNQPLCFGRIDEITGDRWYIGRLGVSGRDQEPLVVDWRAPVAEPFYRATGRFPMGLVRRRHFQVHGRRITGMEDEALVLDDDVEELPVSGQGALLAALERSRSGRMQDIVATIQGEQDEVIRSPLAGVMVVQGGPGTGKTAVALHRAAYLLYTHRFPLERQGVLVLGPNPVFLRYIDNVLPSLGETGVVLSTVSGLVDDVPTRALETPAGAAIKGDSRMAKVVANAVRSRQRGLRHDLVVGYGPYRLRLTPADTAAIVASVRRRGGPHNPRRARIERLVAERLYERYEQAVTRARRITSAARAAEIDDFWYVLKDDPAVREALDRLWPRLHAVELIHDLFGARPLITLAARGVLTNDEAALLYRPRSTSLDEIPWTDADAALVDEARVLLGPPRPLAPDEVLLPTFGHVVVDEAQDLSPMQLRMLGRRCLGGSITLVGDIAQATGPWAPRRWADILQHLPKSWKSREVELTIGYRTPAEAMALAAPVLESTGLGLVPPRPVRSSGEQPVMVLVDDASEEQLVKEVVVRVQAEQALVGEGTVAVVAPRALVPLVVVALGEVGVEASAVNSRVSVMPAELAKGLEFDAVVVVEPAGIVDESPRGLRALYVALTRTTRRLVLVHSQPLPEALSVEEQPPARLGDW